MRRSATRRWSGFRSVLCAVDLSAQSRVALQYARAAVEPGGQLTVCSVNAAVLEAAAVSLLHDSGFRRRTVRALRTFAEGPRQARKRVRERIEVRTGDPVEELLKAIAAAHADLVVVGTSGTNRFERWLIGSTTLGVLRRSPVPVLAIPPTDSSQVVDRRWPGAEVCAAVLVDAGTVRDLERAAIVARGWRASLAVAHVASGTRAASKRAHRRLSQWASLQSGICRVSNYVLPGQPAPALASFVAVHQSGVLIMPMRDRRGLLSRRRGSFSYQIVLRIGTPVLALPPQWQPR